jgi:hypothetical protein
VHAFALNITHAQKSYWTHPIEHLGDVDHWNLISVYLETVLVSVKDRGVVCAKHTVGLEMVLNALDGTPR